MYNRLHSITACDGRADGRTDGQTDILSRHSPRYAYASRGKIRLSQVLRRFTIAGAGRLAGRPPAARI